MCGLFKNAVDHTYASYLHLSFLLLLTTSYPGTANVQPTKPGSADQTRSVMLDLLILLLCNTLLDSSSENSEFVIRSVDSYFNDT